MLTSARNSIQVPITSPKKPYLKITDYKENSKYMQSLEHRFNQIRYSNLLQGMPLQKTTGETSKGSKTVVLDKNS